MAPDNDQNSLIIRQLGLQDYAQVHERMTEFTVTRTEETPDELWFLQHPKVFTQGQAGKAEHVLMPGDIPVVQTDRGGQVTYHGPGQLVVYLMIDIKRLGVGPRQLVSAIESALVETLAKWNITAAAKKDAPGVYTQERKIASLGLRIKLGRSFHGLALNIDMDLEPFHRINPCGYAGMEMTQVKDESSEDFTFESISNELQQQLKEKLLFSAD